MSTPETPTAPEPSGGFKDAMYRFMERVGLAERVEPGSFPHISPVPGTTVPMAFAWIGPDVPHDPPSVVRTQYGILMNEPQAALWEGATFRAACENAQRFFVRGSPPIVPCPPSLMAFWGLPRSPRLDGPPTELRASTLGPQLAVLWHEGPSGPLLATDDVGVPVAARDVTSLSQTYACAVAPLDFAARTRLDALIIAADPTQPHWHVSPMAQSRAPLAFAWFGSDDLAGQPPALLTRGSRPAVWAGRSAHDAVERGLAALAEAQIPAVATRCPPEARSVGLLGRGEAPPPFLDR